MGAGASFKPGPNSRQMTLSTFLSFTYKMGSRHLLLGALRGTKGAEVGEALSMELARVCRHRPGPPPHLSNKAQRSKGASLSAEHLELREAGERLPGGGGWAGLEGEGRGHCESLSR